LVFLEREIWSFVKDDIKVFDFAPVLQSQGCPSPFSIVQHEGNAYFYGTDGFSKLGPDGHVQIGKGWVDDWFLGEVNEARLKTIIGALDPVNMRVYWIYPNSSNTTSYSRNGILCFDMLDEDRPWSKAAIQSEFIFTGSTPGKTLSDLASEFSTLGGVEAAGFSIGSDAFIGGAPRIAAFDTAHKLAFFTGNGVEAVVQTAEFEAMPLMRFYVNGFRLKGDASTATGRVAVAERPQTTKAWKASASLTGQGFIPARASGKILTCEVSVPAWSPSSLDPQPAWSFLSGIDFEAGDLRADGVR
jgi:hypothetical protein